MRKTINPDWMRRLTDVLDRGDVYDEVSGTMRRVSIDEIVSFAPSAKWLVTELVKRNIPFAVLNLPCGVKRITTDTDTCPCCRRKL